MRSSGQKKRLLAVLIGWMLFLLGCDQPRPQQIVEVVTIVPTTPAIVSPETNPTIAAVLAQNTPTDTPSPVPTVTATPFACPTPSGWVLYVIQANDTLVSLAQKTGTAVDTLKAANCLIDDIILIGDPIFLPLLPPPSSPLVSAPPQVESLSTTPACSPFSCPDSSLLAFTLPGGSPNEGNPCLAGEVKVEDWPQARTIGARERGESVYFFACGFTDPASITVELRGPQGVAFPTPQPSQNVPDYQGTPDIPFINLGITCDMPDGLYSVTFTDSQGMQKEAAFTLDEPSFKRILAIPPFGPPGTTFDIYYCGFTPTVQGQEGEEITFHYALDRREQEDQSIDYDWAVSTRWPIIVNENGWTTTTLPSLPNDPIGSYLFLDETQIGFRQIWLVEP